MLIIFLLDYLDDDPVLRMLLHIAEIIINDDDIVHVPPQLWCVRRKLTNRSEPAFVSPYRLAQTSFGVNVVDDVLSMPSVPQHLILMLVLLQAFNSCLIMRNIVACAMKPWSSSSVTSLGQAP